MKKTATLILFIVLCLISSFSEAAAQKCRYDADITNPDTHVRSRRIHVDLDKRWAILFQQEDSLYSVCLLMRVGDTPPEKIVKGSLLHIELENGRLFDVAVSEDSKATAKEEASGNVLVHEVKCMVSRQQMVLFAENALAEMKLYMAGKEEIFNAPDDRTKKQIMKAAACMLKG